MVLLVSYIFDGIGRRRFDLQAFFERGNNLVLDNTLVSDRLRATDVETEVTQLVEMIDANQRVPTPNGVVQKRKKLSQNRSHGLESM